MDKNAKIIGLFKHQDSGCYWYRTKHPKEALERVGLDARMLEIETDIDFYDNIQSVQLYGIYPFQFRKALEGLKVDGKKIVYDMDDAVDLIDESNPFYYSVKKDAKSSLEILEYADEITVSTPVMKELLSKKTNKPITVVPNCFSQREWTFPRHQREGIRVGFAGSCTHVADLINILPIIKKLQAKYDIKFLIMGFGKQSYAEWYRDFSYSSTPEGVNQLIQLNELMKEISFEWIPYVDYQSYPSTLINMALDIGICPLKDTPFNRARSACKAMEYTLSGALALASDLPPYQEDKSSILVKDNEWEQALTFYIEDETARESAHLSHLSWLLQNRDIDSPKIIDLLKSVYEV